MGLLTIIRKIRQKEKEMRILFLGLDNAGKTTILKKLSGEDITGISPTLGFNIKTFVHRQYTLNIWDVGGQRTLRPYWRNYFEQTDALVWVVDACDRMRMQDCKEELHSLLLEDRLAGASLLVLANKQDLPGSLSGPEIRDALDLDSIKSHHWKILPCSAITGENLVEGLDWVVNDVAGRLYYATATSDTSSKVRRASTSEEPSAPQLPVQTSAAVGVSS
ncbi:GTP-binding protein [Gelatoporia subvermispora B]|uniref:ADP-ribosylation factor-like protein 2 n=1 Tax=Ceriporiopsis subvermispora (strain B) TaxID=914234 RepID=M2PWH0_CERS8|nr:GTP-binding protein [Gelatoporia subvermispora B]